MVHYNKQQNNRPTREEWGWWNKSKQSQTTKALFFPIRIAFERAGIKV